MPFRPDLGPKPRLGYSDSRIERAAESRPDASAIAALLRDPAAGTYLIGGDWIVMKKGAPLNEPLFTLAVTSLSGATETIFLGLLDGALAGHGLTPQAADALKAHDDFLSPICAQLQAGPGCGQSSANRRGQGCVALARAPPFLPELWCPYAADVGRMAARLPAMQG